MSATVLLEEDDAPQPRPMALMKGAPEVVRQFLKQVGTWVAACNPDLGLARIWGIRVSSEIRMYEHHCAA
jgi:hypothetical protein